MKATLTSFSPRIVLSTRAVCLVRPICSALKTNNRTGCRFLIVDALNRPETLHYYEKNGFHYLIDDERLEAKYMGIGVGRLPLNTRLMYFDLLKIKVNEE